MSVSQQNSYNSSTGNGVTTVFPYTFKIVAASDLEVSVDGVVKTLTTDYSVSGAGDDNGGNVTFVVAPPDQSRVVRRRNMAFTRTTDYQFQGELPTDVLNDDQDAPILMLQQLKEGLDRSLRFPVQDIGIGTELPAKADRLDRLLAFDPTTGEPEMTTFTQTEVASAIAAAYSGASGPLDALSFIAAGTGAETRTGQDKMRDLVASPDYSSLSTAITAVTAAGGGTILVPNGVSPGALPDDHDSVTLEFLSRKAVNVFQSSGETLWSAKRTLRGMDAGSHSGTTETLLHLEFHPEGSGANGPTNADYGLGVSVLKKDFDTTSVVGEMDVLNLVLRQGGAGSDGCAILANVATYGTGFVGFAETQTSIISGGAATHQIGLQLGICDNVNDTYIGFFARTNIGVSDSAFWADTNPGSTWDYLFRGQKAGVDKFTVNGDGLVSLFDISGNKKSLRCIANTLSVLNSAGTGEIFTLSDIGDLSVNRVTAGGVQLTVAATSVAGGLSLGGTSSGSATAGAGVLPGAPAGFLNAYLGGAAIRIPYYNA